MAIGFFIFFYLRTWPWVGSRSGIRSRAWMRARFGFGSGSPQISIWWRLWSGSRMSSRPAFIAALVCLLRFGPRLFGEIPVVLRFGSRSGSGPGSRIGASPLVLPFALFARGAAARAIIPSAFTSPASSITALALCLLAGWPAAWSWAWCSGKREINILAPLKPHRLIIALLPSSGFITPKLCLHYCHKRI